MARRVQLLLTGIMVLFLCVDQSWGNFFSSLQFTRDSFMDFSGGSERTVEILTPKKTTKTVMKTIYTSSEKKPDKMLVVHRRLSVSGGFGGPFRIRRPTSTAHPRPRTTQVPITETVVTYKKERRVYRQRSSPSNKFLEVLNEIERAVANANASGIVYSAQTLTKQKALVERAVRSKNYKFARQMMGQIMYLLSTKPSAPRREKRSSLNEGKVFLQGLRQSVGSETFDSFMAVQGDVSLMFVMDDTGSMSDEIEAAKNIAIDIINYPRRAPIVTYILSPFNDPYPADSPQVIVKDETEAGEFVEAIKNLRAHGGGDCPEYTFRGMLEALYEGPEVGSPMYVFTDAGPKDATEYDIEEVKLLASKDEYDVTINFFTTGFCRSQGYSGNDPRNLHPAFRDLAEFTLGQAIYLKDQWELEQLAGLTGGALEGNNVVSFGSNMSSRKKRRVGQAADSRYSIPVDDSMEEMIVTVTTTRQNTRGHGITLTDPDNVIITSGKLSLSQISVYEIDNPKRGTWTLAVRGSNGGHEFFVKSSSATNVDFSHYFLTTVPGRRGQMVDVPVANPVLGKPNTLVITLAGSEKVDHRSLRLQLVTTEGHHIRDVALQSRDNDHFTASMTPRAPARTFKLKLRGTTRGGNAFERISRQTVKPTTAVLRGKYASNDYTLPLNRVTFIHFQLCN